MNRKDIIKILAIIVVLVLAVLLVMSLASVSVMAEEESVSESTVQDAAEEKYHPEREEGGRQRDHREWGCHQAVPQR